MYRTGQTIGRAGGAGHAPHLGLVGVFLYACHGGVGVISGRERKTNVGSSLQVGLHLFIREEGTSGLADVVSTMNTNKGISAGSRQWGKAVFVSIIYQRIAINLNCPADLPCMVSYLNIYAK